MLGHWFSIPVELPWSFLQELIPRPQLTHTAYPQHFFSHVLCVCAIVQNYFICQRAQLWKVCKSLHLALHLLITSVRLLKEARGQWVQCWVFWQKGNQCCWFKGHVFGLDARSTGNEIGIIMKNWWVGHVFL